MSEKDELVAAIFGEDDPLPQTETVEEVKAEETDTETDDAATSDPLPEPEEATDGEGSEAKADDPEQDDDETPVTYGRLKAIEAERERRRAAEDAHRKAESEAAALRQQIAELKQKTEAQPVPEWFDDPDTAFSHRLTPIQQEMQAMRTELWRVQAASAHGADVVENAGKALSEAIASGALSEVEAAAMQAPGKNPFAEMVRWHQSRAQAAEIGDMEAYKAKIIAEYLASQQKAPTPTVPKSLQKGVSGSVSTKGGVGSDDPLIKAVYG